MNVSGNDLRLYAVTDRAWLNGAKLEDQVEMAVRAGATFVQLREKHASFDEFVVIAKKIKQVTDRYRVPFVINDNIDVCLAVDADGVHVGQSDMAAGHVRARLGAHKIIGVSAQTVEQALAAQQAGADYLGIGAVFSTSTKEDAQQLSLDSVRDICSAAAIPAVAIGGITLDNMRTLKGLGLCGVAVVSAIFAQRDLFSATQALANEAKNVFA